MVSGGKEIGGREGERKERTEKLLDDVIHDEVHELVVAFKDPPDLAVADELDPDRLVDEAGEVEDRFPAGFVAFGCGFAFGGFAIGVHGEG